MPKQAEFCAPVATYDPDIIFASETWLSATVSSGEFLPDDYIAYHCDRSDGYGGVMVAHRRCIPSHQLFLSDSSCELVACQLDIKPKPVILCAVYRSPSTDLFYMEELCRVLHSLVVDNPSASVWIAGDVNLPDIDWRTNTVCGNQHCHALNDMFVDFLNCNGFIQSVDSPIRNQSILDIFCTNRPLPGISDHEAVLVKTSTVLTHTKPTKQKIYLWNRVDFVLFRNIIQSKVDGMLSDISLASDIDTLWLTFKNLIHSTIDELVPFKFISSSFHQPWITSHGSLAHLNVCVVLSNVNIIKQDILIPRNIGIVLRHSRSKFSLNVRRLTSSMFIVFVMIIKSFGSILSIREWIIVA